MISFSYDTYSNIRYLNTDFGTTDVLSYTLFSQWRLIEVLQLKD